MKLKTLPFFKHKTYLFSFMVIMLGSILYSQKAYSQVDYYYGINKKGLRVGLGLGAGQLQSYWTTSSIGVSARLNIDYDISLFTSIGIEGTFGTFSTADATPTPKLYFASNNLMYMGGSLGFKVALGQFADFSTTNKLQEALKRLYIGAGAGIVMTTADLTPYAAGGPISTPTADGKTGANVKQTSGGNPQHFKGSDPYPFVPLNLGTYIALRGLLGNDKLELNPNFQYNMVLDPLFDGYEPNQREIQVVNGPNTITYKKTSNPSYGIFSIGLRYKF